MNQRWLVEVAVPETTRYPHLRCRSVQKVPIQEHSQLERVYCHAVPGVDSLFAWVVCVDHGLFAQ